MDESKCDPSTRELIAEGEALRGDRSGNPRDVATRQLVREAEQLIGRESSRSSAGRALVVAVVVAAAAVAGLLVYLYA